ncbi:hypothetical protein LSTR_LSTR001310 [Laodelphax striatellus]|uniref:Deoxyribonuclease TATDN1 n=1 Tax=Laodelphax striatellus TaxID=195883 RepID=A0A482XFQ4_LAOST|nr:DNase II [Laodelphax striatellus]RZF44552.1 hypothetical protein LSTR_LSTR001310 [Laodelphax striatellus]
MAAAAVSNAQSMMKCCENYILIDAGANLTNKKFGRDLESVLQRAKDAGVQKMIVPGSSVKSSREALRLARIYPDTIYSTAGVHPHDAKSWTDECLSELRSVADCSECVAIGACGLDYNKDFSSPELQMEAFSKQIELACELKKPLYVHERDAHEDMVRTLAKYRDSLPPVFIHSFSGNAQQARTYVEMGVYLGITGVLCKDNSEKGLQSLLIESGLPLDHLLVETDSPFLYPNARASKLPPHVRDGLTQRSLTFLQRYCTFQRNEPCSLPALVEMVAALLCRSPEDVALATAFNALKVFGLS